MKIISLIVCALSLTFSHAFAEDPVNKVCPVKGKEVDGSKTAEVKVAFCCDKCKAKFDKDPLAGLALFAKSEEGKCPVSGKDVDSAVTSTVAVAVCCDGCKGKVEEDPRKHLASLGEKKKAE